MKSISKFTFSRLVLVAIAVVSLFSFSPAQSTYTYENFPNGNWVLIGFPAVLGNNDPGAVLSPTFGTVGVGGGWRFSRWNIPNNTYLRYGEAEYVWDANSQSYLSEKQEIGSPPNIQPGFGYWLVQQKAADIDLSVSGTAVSTSEPYYIQLDPPQGGFQGRNMVANPFLSTIDWADVEVKATYTDQSTEEMSLLEANNAGLLDQHAYPWEGDHHVGYTSTEGGDLQVWDGFWVEQLNATQSYNLTYKVTHYGEGHQNGKGGDHDVRSIKLHQPLLEGHNGPWDELGEDPFKFFTDIFTIIVENGTDDIWIEVRVNNNEHWTYFNYSTENSKTLDDAFLVTITDKTLVDDDTYRYTIHVQDVAGIEGLHQIAFDFGDGTNVEDPYPQGNTRTSVQRISTSSSSPVSLELKVSPPSSKGGLSKGLTGTRMTFMNSEEWMMHLNLWDADDKVIDENGFGVLNNASIGYDVNDIRNYAPPLTSFGDIYFQHGDECDYRNYWTQRPCAYSYDIRSDSSTNVWNFEILAREMASQTMTMKWDASLVSTGYDTLQLTDLDNQVLVDMRSVNQYAIAVPAGQSNFIQHFEIYATYAAATVNIGNETTARTYRLLDNYPNPFNASTNIRFGIDRKMWVKVDIYSLKGEKIRTLVNDLKSPGTYLVNWNGTDARNQTVPSGVYLCRVTSDDFSKTHKMLLLK